jgi:hypothetical protein
VIAVTRLDWQWCGSLIVISALALVRLVASGFGIAMTRAALAPSADRPDDPDPMTPDPTKSA